MGKKSRRRKKRSKEQPAHCAVFGCENTAFTTYRQCAQPACAECLLGTATFCYHEGPGTELFHTTCPFCRERTNVGSVAQLARGAPSNLKRLMASAGRRMHLVPNGCCGPKGQNDLVLVHFPCQTAQCYECQHSWIKVMREGAF